MMAGFTKNDFMIFIYGPRNVYNFYWDVLDL